MDLWNWTSAIVCFYPHTDKNGVNAHGLWGLPDLHGNEGGEDLREKRPGMHYLIDLAQLWSSGPSDKAGLQYSNQSLRPQANLGRSLTSKIGFQTGLEQLNKESTHLPAWAEERHRAHQPSSSGGEAAVWPSSCLIGGRLVLRPLPKSFASEADECRPHPPFCDAAVCVMRYFIVFTLCHLGSLWRVREGPWHDCQWVCAFAPSQAVSWSMVPQGSMQEKKKGQDKKKKKLFPDCWALDEL